MVDLRSVEENGNNMKLEYQNQNARWNRSMRSMLQYPDQWVFQNRLGNSIIIEHKIVVIYQPCAGLLSVTIKEFLP